MAKRYLVNEDTGVVFNWNEHMAPLPNMRECNEKGKQITAQPTDIDNSGDEVEVELESLNWHRLKDLVEAKGVEYTNKKEAIALLRGE